MRITELSVKNYKSLRSVTLRPRAFNILVGPNDSGKSNFADCFSFLADVYREGLKYAVTKKGGYDNVVYRRHSRSRAPISFSVVVEHQVPRNVREVLPSGVKRIRYAHEFSFRTRGTSIREDYFIDREIFSIALVDGGGHRDILTLQRTTSQIEADTSDEFKQVAYALDEVPMLLNFLDVLDDFVTPSEVMTTLISRFVPNGKRFVAFFARLQVFQFSPAYVRQPVPPTPDAELERYGGNLPAVIESIQRSGPEQWDMIMSVMRRINPRLTAIKVDYAASRLLGLYFYEQGVGRPWSYAEVSDGTVQALAMLVAIFDRNSNVIILEEPENSVHPWIARNIVEACRSVSKRKQIILTTHSPVLIDLAKPAEVSVVWREAGGTSIRSLRDLEPGIENSWRNGDIAISQLLDTGLLDPYVPAGVRPSSFDDLMEEG